jgi:tRNA(fMet)-specific endonuclease VapC
VDRVALDTTFLIDLQHDRRARAKARGALAYLRANRNTELLLPAVVLGEYLEGFEDPTGEAARSLVAPLRVLGVTADVATRYAENARSLRAAGRLIGANDLWIACTALAAGVAILTRNAAHFGRVAGLKVVDYSA